MQRTPTRLTRALLGALFLLTQGTLALAQSPAGTADTKIPYEWEVVSTASRKMLEVQRETDACVVNDVPSFFAHAGLAYGDALAAPEPRKDTPVMYGAMQTAGGAMKGRGPASFSSFERLYHVTSAKSFFNFNVSDNWKRLEATKLSEQLGKEVTPDSPEVRNAWEDAVTNGKDIPKKEMLMPDSLALPALSWVTPDPDAAIPGAPDRAQGTDDFFRICHILSLAPEWYPEGLVNMNYAARGKPLLRPVSYDGMLSPLWVQQAPDKPAATGGGATEAFNRDDVRLSEMVSMQAYIVAHAMTDAINETSKKSVSVNLYSVDLHKVAQGSDPATERLGKEQADIVRQVRAARRTADASFKTVVPAPVKPAPQCATRPVKHTMLLPSGRGDLTGPALQTEMARWALGHYVQNRGQRFAAERFDDAMARAPGRMPAVMAAATALLRQSGEPDVLAMAAQLGRASGYRPFYVALIDRLSGKPRPLPAGPGIRTLTLKGDLLLRLEDSMPATDSALARRAVALADREGRPDLRLAMALNQDSGAALLAAFAGATHYAAIDPWLAARAGNRIAQVYPDRLAQAARAAAALPPLARRLFMTAARAARDHRMAAR